MTCIISDPEKCVDPAGWPAFQVDSNLTYHLGSVVAMVKPDGDLRNVHQHEPYGKLHRSVAYDEFDFGFNGQVFDEGFR